MNRDVVNRMTGWNPAFMSAAAFALVVTTGWERNLRDEGAAAHTWQLQAPLIMVFLATAKWDRMRRMLGILGLQIAGLARALAPVAYIHL
jgi:hypothetical protein